MTDGTDHGRYEAVEAYPEGEATVDRYARTLSRYGYQGLIVRTQDADFDADGVAERRDIDVVPAVEFAPTDPSVLSGRLGAVRSEYSLLLVQGGSERLNRFVVEQNRVDVLTRPFVNEGDVNHVMINAAKKHDVRIEFDFGPVLRASGGPRVRHLKNLRKLRELVEDGGAPFVISTRPASQFHLRAPRELAAIGQEIGFAEEQVLGGLSEWGRLVARNRERLSGEFIAPGVRHGRYEEDDRGTR